MRTSAAGLERSAVAMLRLLGAGAAWLVLAQTSDATAQAGLGITNILLILLRLKLSCLLSCGCLLRCTCFCSSS